jgi:hypothetical protein
LPTFTGRREAPFFYADDSWLQWISAEQLRLAGISQPALPIFLVAAIAGSHILGHLNRNAKNLSGQFFGAEFLCRRCRGFFVVHSAVHAGRK